MRSSKLRNDFYANYVLGCGARLLRDLVFFGAVGFGSTAPGDRFDFSDPVVGVRADELRVTWLARLNRQSSHR